MGKKLAIRGHSMRGKEVIKLLEMMGGKNCFHLNGLFSEHAYYFIGGPHNDEIRAGEYMFDEYAVLQMIDDMCFFTLEEFLEKYPFYVGNRVFDIADGDPGIISAMKWDEDVSDMKYQVWFDNGDIGWYTYDTIEFLKEDNKEMNRNIETNQCKVNGLKRGDEYPIMEGVECNECIKYYFPDGYEFVDTDDTGVYLKPIKTKYPKTYAECCKVLGVNPDNYLTLIFNVCHNDRTNYEKGLSDIFDSLWKLIICCKAYWKIAGEEMGLGKPWEPDWKSLDKKYNIYNYRGVISLNFTVLDRCILIFPTEEIRNTFYENFKELIEQCKEFL